jgi:hypothetical protein
MAATRADLGCLLCKKISTDLSASQWGITAEGGYFNLVYELFALPCGDTCNTPSFTATEIPDVVVTCALTVTQTPPPACSNITLIL